MTTTQKARAFAYGTVLTVVIYGGLWAYGLAIHTLLIVGTLLVAAMEPLAIWADSRLMKPDSLNLGAHGMVGSVGVVTRACEPRGQVQINAEYWSARSDTGEALAVGSRVVVTTVEGLEARVRRPDPAA